MNIACPVAELTAPPGGGLPQGTPAGAIHKNSGSFVDLSPGDPSPLNAIVYN